MYLILAFMVLSLSTRPCCADNCSDKAPAVTKSSSQSAPNDKDCAACSPFACYCTGFIISKPFQYTLFTPANIFIKHTVSYQQPYVEDVAQAIWQPPKLS